MDDEISSCLVSIKERYRTVSFYHTKQYPCHLKTVNVCALELLESVVEKESDIEFHDREEGRQVRIPYNCLFDPTYSEITLKPNSTAPRKVILIQGEAAMGKTMLCMSIVEEWASGKLFQEFQLVLLLPLSSRNVASASSLSGLLNVLYADFKGDSTCSTVAKYLTEKKSHYNILLIADGWEELQDSQCQAGSFLHSLLFSSDIIPTSSTTVLITSRPGCFQILNVMQSANNRLITLTGFDRRAIESVVQSEFAGDLRRIRYLTAQLKDNPLVASVCSTPFNLAIVCDLCQASYAEPLPDTVTELYSKLIWTLASARLSVESGDPHESRLSSHHDLPEELQRPWWQACEVAFRNIEKDHSAFSSSDSTLTSSNISHLGLTKPRAETGDTLSSPFVHPRFEEYLAALHLAKQPKEAQIKNL